jgi:hypothetical protein
MRTLDQIEVQAVSGAELDETAAYIIIAVVAVALFSACLPSTIPGMNIANCA